MNRSIVIDLRNIEALLKSRQNIRLSVPYECFNGKIGVEIKYLVSDRCSVLGSLNLISYRALASRMLSKTMCERRLRRSSKLHTALIELGSLDEKWRTAIIQKFGNPIELC